MAGLFEVVRCPRCQTVVAEVASNSSTCVRVKCSRCKARPWIVANGKVIRVGIVDAPPKRLISSGR